MMGDQNVIANNIDQEMPEDREDIAQIAKYDLFKKLRNNLTKQQKIQIKVERFDNGYFLNKDIATIPADISEDVRPLRKVTESLLDAFISKNEIVRDRKLSWIVKNLDQPYAAEFKNKFENNGFQSVCKAQDLAGELFKSHNPDYKAAQAVISKGDNGRVVTRKADRVQLPAVQAAAVVVVNPATDPVALFKRALREKVIGEAPLVKGIVTRENKQLKVDVAVNSEVMKLARTSIHLPLADDIRTVEDRRTVGILANIFQLLED
jgi:hypothetical protein